MPPVNSGGWSHPGSHSGRCSICGMMGAGFLFSLLLNLLLPGFCKAQRILTLQECYEMA